MRCDNFKVMRQMNHTCYDKLEDRCNSLEAVIFLFVRGRANTTCQGLRFFSCGHNLPSFQDIVCDACQSSLVYTYPILILPPNRHKSLAFDFPLIIKETVK